jgi:hypothetical protein
MTVKSKNCSRFVTLENGVVKFSFSKKTGSVIQIKDMQSRKEFLSDTSGARLFRLIVPEPAWPARFADSHEAGTPDFYLHGDTLSILYKDVLCQGKRTGIEAKIKVRLAPQSKEALFTLELINKSRSEIEEVRFPWIGGFKQIDGPGKDTITVASRHFDPHTMFPTNDWAHFLRGRHKLMFSYPFPLFQTFMDISGEKGGLSYVCYQNKLKWGALGFEQLNPFEQNKSLSWSWASSPLLKPGNSWRSPEVGIGIHNGDWHKTADRFREWVNTWWRNPNPPRELKESIGIMNLQFTSFDGSIINQFKNLPLLAQECKKSGLTHICLWHRAGGNYMANGSTKDIMDEPPRLLKELKAALSRVNKAGINMSIILNLRLAIKTKDIYDFALNEAVLTRYGSPHRESYTGTVNHIGGLNAIHYNWADGVTMCQRPNSPYADRARRIIDKMLDLGFTSIFIDQPLNFMCLNPAHKHGSPEGVPGEAVQWMKEVAKQVKGHSKKGYIIGELPEMCQTENVDLWWYWDWKYLAPEVYRYAMPDALQMWVVDDDLGELNRSFAMGFYLNFVIAGMERNITARPHIAHQCKLLAKLRKRTAAWTVDNRFVDKIGLKQLGKNGGTEAYVFAGKATAAVIIAETQGQAASFQCSFDPAKVNIICESPQKVQLINGGFIRTAQPKKGIHTLNLKLKPYKVAIWTFSGTETREN